MVKCKRFFKNYSFVTKNLTFSLEVIHMTAILKLHIDPRTGPLAKAFVSGLVTAGLTSLTLNYLSRKVSILASIDKNVSLFAAIATAVTTLASIKLLPYIKNPELSGKGTHDEQTQVSNAIGSTMRHVAHLTISAGVVIAAQVLYNVAAPRAGLTPLTLTKAQTAFVALLVATSSELAARFGKSKMFN
jgi:hypothetical protein